MLIPVADSWAKWWSVAYMMVATSRSDRAGQDRIATGGGEQVGVFGRRD